MPRTRANRALLEDIREFQLYEIRLLQEGHYREWLDLLTEDVTYWMPLRQVAETRDDCLTDEEELAHFNDTFETLKVRIERMYSKRSWTEFPPSHTRYFVQLLDAEPCGADGEVKAISNFLIYQSRLQRERDVFVGVREDVLRPVAGDWKIAYRKIVIDESVLGAKGLTILF